MEHTEKEEKERAQIKQRFGKMPQNQRKALRPGEKIKEEAKSIWGEKDSRSRKGK